jgi:hypothetical protein
MHRISKWRKKAKTGRHLFISGGVRKTIMPGDIVECTEQALGNQAKHYERLTPAVKEVEKEEPAKMLQLVKVSRYTYNIVNPDNPKKPLNDKPMKKEDAESMLGKLSVAKSDTDINSLDWNALIGIMEEEGIDILETYETEEHLRDAIVAAHG